MALRTHFFQFIVLLVSVLYVSSAVLFDEDGEFGYSSGTWLCGAWVDGTAGVAQLVEQRFCKP